MYLQIISYIVMRISPFEACAFMTGILIWGLQSLGATSLQCGTGSNRNTWVWKSGALNAGRLEKNCLPDPGELCSSWVLFLSLQAFIAKEFSICSNSWSLTIWWDLLYGSHFIKWMENEIDNDKISPEHDLQKRIGHHLSWFISISNYFSSNCIFVIIYDSTQQVMMYLLFTGSVKKPFQHSWANLVLYNPLMWVFISPFIDREFQKSQHTWRSSLVSGKIRGEKS